MQRLTERTGRERGAVAVVVALLMVPLMGFAALAIDVSSMWSQQQRLQVAADASALAVAQDCARGNCGDASSTAQVLADDNFAGATAHVLPLPPTLSPSTGQVEVSATFASHHLFARVLEVTNSKPIGDSQQVGAVATASWYQPNRGTAILPLTFSWCDFYTQTKGGLPFETKSEVINFDKDYASPCTGPSHLELPGGFGWVVPDKGCMKGSTISGLLPSDSGNALPIGCSETDFAAQLNRIVLLPLFDAVCDLADQCSDVTAMNPNANYKYRVYGYVAFKLTGYKFQQSHMSGGDTSLCGKNCIKGYFTQFADVNQDFTGDPDSPPAPPGLGAEIVTLTS